MVENPKRLPREKLAILGNDIRLGIITSLLLGPASVAELAAELEVPVAKVRYHLNRMRDVNLVELYGETSRRGVTENLFTVDPRKNLMEPDEMEGLPRHRFDRPYTRLLKQMFREVAEAVEARNFRSRPEHTGVRLPLPLDERGWRESAAIYRQLIDEVLTVREASLNRLEASGETPIKALGMILSFERAADGSG
ncbi:MAG TPA: winged helix-turn-helix domain-containing protein [Solirubrobacterales bacterium]|nr:winged helix-turn-helix domain-containing protein [Solirubrobacterales bacterium]